MFILNIENIQNSSPSIHKYSCKTAQSIAHSISKTLKTTIPNNIHEKCPQLTLLVLDYCVVYVIFCQVDIKNHV